MNKPRIVGIILIIIGIAGKMSLGSGAIQFLLAIVIGFGIGMLITGRFTNGKQVHN